MAPVLITAVISATSEDMKYPVSNILGNKKWLTSGSDNHRESCEIVLQLRMPSIIQFIDIGYINISSMEISVGCSWWPPSRLYDTILPPIVLQTSIEARTGKNKMGCKMFNCPEHLNSDVCKGKWDRLKITLKQNYSKNKQMGLEFVRISNSRTLKDKKQEDSTTPFPSENPKESLDSSKNLWKNSALARMHHQADSGKTPEIDNLKDKLLRISGTTEDGSSNENTLSRTARMVLSSRASASQSTLQRPNFKSSKTISNSQVDEIDLKDTSIRATSSPSTSYARSSIKGFKAGSSNEDKHVDLKNTTSQTSSSRAAQHKSNIKSPKSDASHKQDMKNATSSLSKIVTPNGKQCIKLHARTTLNKSGCDSTKSQYDSVNQIKSPKIVSYNRVRTPDSKRVASPNDETPKAKSYSKLHTKQSPPGNSNCDLSMLQYDDPSQTISPINMPCTKVRPLKSKSTTLSKNETPNAKLHSSRGPSSNSNNDANDRTHFNGIQKKFTQDPTTSSKSAPSPKLKPKSHGASFKRKVSVAENEHQGNHLPIDVIGMKSDVSMETGNLSKSEIKRIKKRIEVFFNSLDIEEMDPDKVTLKELRVGFEVMNDIKLDKNGREYFRNATANFLGLVMNIKQHKNSGKKTPGGLERKRKNESESATTSKSRRLSSDVDDCEIVQTTQGVQCPLCMNYFPQKVVADHAALCGDDQVEEFADHDVEIISTSRPRQQHQRETFIDLSDNMGLTEEEKQRWLNFSRKPKPYHPRMDTSLFQGQRLVKCPTCGQYYKSNEIQEHSDDCTEKVNSGFVKRGLYFVKDGS